jgi:Flp pilus assembly protein TadG
MNTNIQSFALRARRDQSCVRARFLANNEEGQALIEFALVLPILMMILTGVFTFGITLNNYLALTNAVGIGGELLSVSRGQTADPCATVVTAIQSAAPRLNWATTPAPTYSIKLTPQGGAATSYGASCSSATLSTLETARITVTYPCTLSLYNFIAPNCTLAAQVTELVQ